MSDGEYPAPPDIRSVLEHYGIRTYRKVTLCPFHEDTVPSFSVNYDKGLYKCHACGESGNTWTLLKKKEGLTFGEAIEFAATTEWIAEGSAANGSTTVSGSAYGGRRTVSRRKRDHKGHGKFVPSWRRGGS